MKQATEVRVARGWESKAIEQQQDEASRRGESSGPREPSATDRRRSLELARAQLIAQQAAARTDAHTARRSREQSTRSTRSSPRAQPNDRGDGHWTGGSAATSRPSSSAARLSSALIGAPFSRAAAMSAMPA